MHDAVTLLYRMRSKTDHQQKQRAGVWPRDHYVGKFVQGCLQSVIAIT